jgi:hypothetical protein
MPTTYSDLVPDHDNNVKAMGGTQQIGYFGSIPDFETIAKPTAPFTNPEDEYVILTPHVMKEGKKMLEFYTEQNRGEVTYEPIGSLDSTGFKASAKAFLPSETKKGNYMANKVRQSKYIVLFPDADGTINQIGTKEFPATIKMAKKTSTNENGALGYEIEIEAIMPKKLIYDAAVPTEVAE